MESCGSARRTAAATVASSSLMSCTISSDDIWSRFAAVLRICSVGSCRRSDFWERDGVNVACLSRVQPLRRREPSSVSQPLFGPEASADVRGLVRGGNLSLSLRTRRILSAISAVRKGSYTLHDRIMDPGPYLLDRLIGAIRPGAIGQKSNRQVPIRINPERSSCIPKVAVGVRSEVCARL